MSNPGPGAQPVIIYADGSPVSALNPLPTSGGGGGGGTVTQGAGNSDATKGWSSRLTDGSAFIVPAKTGQLPAALGATSAASSLAVGIATDQLSTLATAAKQPALGTAGTPSTDVLSVQGVVGGTPILVSATPSGTQDVNLTKVGGSAIALGQKTAANSLPVVLASDTGTLTVASNVTPGSLVSETQQNCSTAAIILAAVASPKVRKIYNRAGNGRLFLRYGSAPTAETDCNFALNPGDTWEMPSIAPGVLEYAGNIYGLIPSGSASVNGLQVT